QDNDPVDEGSRRRADRRAVPREPEPREAEAERRGGARPLPAARLAAVGGVQLGRLQAVPRPGLPQRRQLARCPLRPRAGAAGVAQAMTAMDRLPVSAPELQAIRMLDDDVLAEFLVEIDEGGWEEARDWLCDRLQTEIARKKNGG